MLTLVLLGVVAWCFLAKGLLTAQGKPLGYDFITFWAASRMGLDGHPQDAYNVALIFQAETAAVPGIEVVFAWFYPPTFYLLILPLALLPYLVAYFAFLLPTLAAYVVVFRRIAQGREAMWCLAAFSGAWMNVVHGQNAFLTAALAAAALLCLERRPIVSGILIGLLAIKPHLAVLFPVALAASGAWATFFVAGATALLLITAGTAVLGTATLSAFLGSLPFVQNALETGALPWIKMPTIFAMLRLVNAPVPAAWLAQGIVACAAALAVWIVWRRSRELALRASALMTATFLVSPYAYDYDLAGLAFPIAWLAVDGIRRGWLRGEREVLLAAWLLPLPMAPLAAATSIQTGPIALVGLLLLILRRAALVREGRNATTEPGTEGSSACMPLRICASSNPPEANWR
ncbi:glycosyltransferase family 87 protein [Cupriavidus yeoncheonensis]